MNILALIPWVLLAALPAQAQDKYPSRPVNIIVPYAPGGVADVYVRPFAEMLRREMNQSFVVVNRPGASGSIGTQAVARAAPDGYTLLGAFVQMSVLPEVDSLFGRPRTYELDQLVGVARLVSQSVTLAAGASTPWRSLKELVEDARRRPGAITFSTGGPYAGNHLPVELFAQAAGIKLLAIPYKGGGPSLTALLGGEVQLTVLFPGNAVTLGSAGKVRVLGTLSAARIRELPEVPTMKELGYDVEFNSWAGVFAPKGTPKAVLDALDAASARAYQSAEYQAFLAKQGVGNAYLGSEAFNRWWLEDARKLGEVVRRIGKVE